MSRFRRRQETLNDKLLRESEHSPEEPAAEAAALGEEPDPVFGAGARLWRGASGRRGLGSGASLWARGAHVVATAELPELHGEEYAFTRLSDGSIITEAGDDEDASRLADAVGARVRPPYRAAAVRHGDGLWTVSARPIDVATVVTDGDEVELTSLAGARTYTVDGQGVSENLVPAEFAELGQARSNDYSLHAVRIRGELWDVRVDPL